MTRLFSSRPQTAGGGTALFEFTEKRLYLGRRIIFSIGYSIQKPICEIVKNLVQKKTGAKHER